MQDYKCSSLPRHARETNAHSLSPHARVKRIEKAHTYLPLSIDCYDQTEQFSRQEEQWRAYL